MPLDVEAHAGDLDDLGEQRLVLTATQHRADPGDELAVAERLGDVVVGAELQAHDLVDLGVPRRDHDDPDVAARPQLPAHLGARHAGHHEIEQHQVRAVRVVQREAGRAVGRLEHLEALLAEHEARGVAVGLLVLDDQDPRHVIPLLRTCRRGPDTRAG